jgi:hypothetical protein
MNKAKALFCVLVCVLAQANASGITFTFFEEHQPGIVLSPGGFTTYISIFDLRVGQPVQNYDPATMQFTDAFLSFQFSNENDSQSRSVDILLDSGLFTRSWTSAGIFDGIPDGSPGEASALLPTLQANNGVLIVTFFNFGGPAFTIDSVRLDATAESKTGVPDAGSTVILLGMAMGALEIARRRFNS